MLLILPISVFFKCSLVDNESQKLKQRIISDSFYATGMFVNLLIFELSGYIMKYSVSHKRRGNKKKNGGGTLKKYVKTSTLSKYIYIVLSVFFHPYFGCNILSNERKETGITR